MNIKEIDIKKILITILVVFLIGYVFWDISLKIVNHFRFQGYAIAVSEIMREAKNEDCEPFNIFAGEDEVHFINIDCLNKENEMSNSELPEMMPRGGVEMGEEMLDDGISNE